MSSQAPCFFLHVSLCLVTFHVRFLCSQGLPALRQLHLVTLNPLEKVSGTAVSLYLQANAQKVQRRLTNKPRHPAELAADIVERVVATRAEPYLETRKHSLTWWQLALLDVKLFLLMTAAVMIVAIGVLVWCIVRAVIVALAMTVGFGKHQSVSNDKKHS